MATVLSPVQQQVDTLAHDLHAGAERGLSLLRPVSEEELWKAPAAGRWSVGECIEHLNLTHTGMLAAMQSALAAGEPGPPAKAYRLDLTGWLLVKFLEPSQRLRLKTSEGFVPGSDAPRPSRDVLQTRFAELLQRVWDLARRGVEIDFSRLRMESPFRAGMRYSLYSGFRITEVHLRRHLQQAEAALEQVGSGRQ